MAMRALLLCFVAAGRADWLVTTVANHSSAQELTTKIRARLAETNQEVEHAHTEEIRSFYWWDGKVQEEPEVRTTIDSQVPFAALLDILQSEHPYEVPMIISRVDDEDQTSSGEGKYLAATAYLNDTASEEAAELAKELVQVRYVACAQVGTVDGAEKDQLLTLKTTAASKEQIQVDFGGLTFGWMPIRGNKPYLDWVAENVKIRSHASEL